MANIKSSAKRVLVSRVRAERNKADKSELKTTIKKFDAAATVEIDKACSKGVYHKNNAARKKSSMASKMNALSE